MRELMIITITFLLAAGPMAMAQSPVPESDTVSNPIQQGDPALRTLPPRMDYVEDKRRIMPDEVPQPVRQTLESSANFKDWQKATIFHDENKDEYIVEFAEADKRTSYRFNKEGRPIIEE